MCHTCFTGLTIVGKLVFGKNKDTRDVTSIIISLFGNKDVVGGNTLYFNLMRRMMLLHPSSSNTDISKQVIFMTFNTAEIIGQEDAVFFLFI